MKHGVDRVADQLKEFTDIFFPPIAAHYSKAERTSLAKAGAQFARAAAAILTFIENGKISEIRKQELTNHFFAVCAACQQAQQARRDAIKRLENEIKKLPPKRQKFVPKIIN